MKSLSQKLTASEKKRCEQVRESLTAALRVYDDIQKSITTHFEKHDSLQSQIADAERTLNVLDDAAIFALQTKRSQLEMVKNKLDLMSDSLADAEVSAISVLPQVASLRSEIMFREVAAMLNEITSVLEPYNDSRDRAAGTAERCDLIFYLRAVAADSWLQSANVQVAHRAVDWLSAFIKNESPFEYLPEPPQPKRIDLLK